MDWPPFQQSLWKAAFHRELFMSQLPNLQITSCLTSSTGKRKISAFVLAYSRTFEVDKESFFFTFKVSCKLHEMWESSKMIFDPNSGQFEGLKKKILFSCRAPLFGNQNIVERSLKDLQIDALSANIDWVALRSLK